MANAKISGEVTQNAGAILYADVRDQDHNSITQAALTSIIWTLFDHSTGTPTPVGGYENQPLTIANVVYDTPQSPPTGITTTYNFRHIIPAAALTQNIKYRVEYKFSPAAGEPFILIAELTVTPTYID